MPESQAQVRYAHVVLAGKAKKKGGMDKATAAEIVGKMHGRSMKELPERKGKVQRARRVR
jgi:hypothetical protein